MQYLPDFPCLGYTHHSNQCKHSQHKSSPTLDLNLLSHLWDKCSQCEGHQLIPTLHKDPLGKSQHYSSVSG